MSLNEKLLDVQKAAPTIAKNARNPHFGQRYATLDTILETIVPLLNERGLILTQGTKTEARQWGTTDAVVSRIIDTESGEFIDSSLTIPVSDNPQRMGSAITYARRYTLMSLLALTADEDDDGEAAARHSREDRAVPEGDIARPLF